MALCKRNLCLVKVAQNVCKIIIAVIINIQFQLLVDYNILKLKYRLCHSDSLLRSWVSFVQLKNASGGISENIHLDHIKVTKNV
jgi:hypothetical protein